jgi:hypothetical protein
MVIFSVICIILAIMSTRPKVSSGTFTRKEIEEKKVNLLFFGNFYKMPMEEVSLGNERNDERPTISVRYNDKRPLLSRRCS